MCVHLVDRHRFRVIRLELLQHSSHALLQSTEHPPLAFARAAGFGAAGALIFFQMFFPFRFVRKLTKRTANAAAFS